MTLRSEIEMLTAVCFTAFITGAVAYASIALGCHYLTGALAPEDLTYSEMIRWSAISGIGSTILVLLVVSMGIFDSE